MSVRPQLSDAQLGERCLLDEAAMARTLLRLAHEVLERHPGLSGVLLAGVRTRGLPLASRVARALQGLGAPPVPVAELDIDGYRDDRPRHAVPRGDALRLVGSGHVPPVDGAAVIVVDDVFYTGRTLRAALDALAGVGRPASVDLLVLVDRGHRELPMRATFVGKNVPTAPDERVAVRVREVDGFDGAFLVGAPS
jgi:pyrimidine operon attenuation protein / uracil phosphoribosyltransferase